MSMALHMDRQDMSDLSNRDFLFAGGFHLLVVLLLVLFSIWHSSSPPPEPQSVEVHLVSRAQLEKALHHRPPVHREHHRRPAPEHHARPAPKPVVHHETHAMPALKKPAPKHKAKPAPKKKEEPFDPFQPLSSTSDRDTPTSALSTSASKALEEDLASQLSQKEIDRYHAMIINAIEQHWKVSNFSSDVHDPRVEMTLNPNGSVQNVQILESSGSDAVDASVVRAIQAAGPFTIPSQQYELFHTMKFRFNLKRD